MPYCLAVSALIFAFMFIKLNQDDTIISVMRFLWGLAAFAALVIFATYGYKHIASSLNETAAAVGYAYMALVALLTVSVTETPTWNPDRRIVKFLKLILTIHATVYGWVALLKFGLIS